MKPKLEYPKETNGSKWAAENRKRANKLTPKQRAYYFKKGMEVINSHRPTFR